MNDLSFAVSKKITPHSTLTNFVFQHRSLLLAVTGLVSLSCLYFDVRGALLPQSLVIVLTAMGASLLASGLFLRLWASLYIVRNRNKRLVSSGPYSIIRNPLYVGNFTAVFGAMLITGSFAGTVMCFAGMMFVYYFTIKYEDARLEQHFSNEFVEFREKVPRVIPSIRNMSSLVTREATDTVCYANVKKELVRAFHALIVVLGVVAFTYASRYGIF